MGKKISHINICNSVNPKHKDVGCCSERGSGSLIDAFNQYVATHKLEELVAIKPTPCLSNCANGISVRILEDLTLYCEITEKDVADIIQTHCLKRKVVKHLKVLKNPWSFLD